MKYAWAAYRRGGLEDLNPIFGADMGIADFKEAFPELLLSYGNNLFALVGPVPNQSSMPVGMVAALIKGKVIHDTHFIWFPWASARVKLETAAHFLDMARRDFFVMGFPDETQQNERFFNAIVDMGILKRGGRFHGLHPGRATLFYYSRI